MSFFKEMIEHSQPTLGEEEKRAILDVLGSNYIAEGEEVHKFEKEMAKYVGATGGVVTSTGTLGLHLALICLDLTKNDEVIIPSYTCRSVLNAVLYSGAKPVLCDVDCDDYNISLFAAKKRITKKTKAVIVPHMFGHPARVDEFKKLGVHIIEDCAHSIGAKYKKRKVGSFGDVALFSFEGTKYIVTGEGGMVLANSQRLLNKLRKLKEPDSSDFLTKYTYRMTDLQAAIGRVQLKKLEGLIKKRRSIAKIYTQAFRGASARLPKDCEGGRHIYQRYMIQIKGDIHAFMAKCLKRGIKVKQPVKPYALHRYLGESAKHFPNTEYIMNSAVSIPIYSSLTDNQVNLIIETVKRLLKEHA